MDELSQHRPPVPIGFRAVHGLYGRAKELHNNGVKKDWQFPLRFTANLLPLAPG